MERKTGFKECPKCGLRNKPGATQCDFCGQHLGPSDDWQQHIKDLESLNKMELRKPLDDRTSKRIEATIIRKDAPVARNMEIREAGNIGKVLRELDAPPVREKSRETKEERPRQTTVQEKLRIKEAGSLPLVEREPEERSREGNGTTIADLMKETDKEPETSTKPDELQTVEPEGSQEPVEIKAAEEPVVEIVEKPLPEVESPPEQSKTEETTPPAEEPFAEERSEESPAPSAVAEPAMVNVPAKEVTVEVVRPLQEDLSPADTTGNDEGEVAISTNDSRETIKLKLVEVERPRERLTPMLVLPRAGPRGTAAIAVLALGSVAYLVVLTLTAMGALDVVTGLGGGAVSSFRIIFGAAVVYPSLRRRKEDEVYICPKCHEKVEESSDGCPACGAEFESED
jgi:hypothetical protein